MLQQVIALLRRESWPCVPKRKEERRMSLGWHWVLKPLLSIEVSNHKMFNLFLFQIQEFLFIKIKRVYFKNNPD